jgi:hypothetical protein
VARVASDNVGSDDSEFSEHRFDIRGRGRDGNDWYPVLDSEVTVLWILAVVRRRELTWDPFLPPNLLARPLRFSERLQAYEVLVANHYRY